LATICGGKGSDQTLAELGARLRGVTDANRCFLGTEEQVVVSSVLREFPEDVAELLEHGGSPTRVVRVPLIHDIADDGTVEYATVDYDTRA
jgi:hypothetical protein